MKIDETEMMDLVKLAMESEADDIMAEVNSAPELQDVVAPNEMHNKLIRRIRRYERRKKLPWVKLWRKIKMRRRAKEESPEDREELVRLGKKYKKEKGRRKYLVLIAAVVCALAVGTISLGDGKKVIQDVKDMIAGKEQMNIDENGERTKEITSVSEEDAYEQIDEIYGFYPVQMGYLPEGMEFEELFIDNELQSARLYYADQEEKRISCYIATGHREGSVGTDVEDELLQEYEKEVNGVLIDYQEYRVDGLETSRWCLNFTYKEVQYSIIMTGIKTDEVEKIVENLYFS